MLFLCVKNATHSDGARPLRVDGVIAAGALCTTQRDEQTR
jgi:hypothetical protein